MSPIIANPTMRCPAVDCGKKLAITDLKCKACGETHCSRHRLPEQHACKKLEELKVQERADLAGSLPKVVAEKVIKISSDD